jgi:glycerol-3-phosphate dehydrogenase subunit C
VAGIDLINAHCSRTDLTKETVRVYDVCDGCRRCFNLCPSFGTLFDRIDARDGEVAGLAAPELDQIADECYYCKLCYNHCPYTPPHQYAIDFPRLMIAWKRQMVRERGARWRDRLLVQTDLLGTLGSLCAPFVNWALRSRVLRRTAEVLLGIHHERRVLPYRYQTLPRWWKQRQGGRDQSVPLPQKIATTADPVATGVQAAQVNNVAKVALFSGCLLNYQATHIGKAAVQVLEKNGVQVALPNHRCCGMPLFDLGDTDGIRQAAAANCAAFSPWLDAGYDIVAPVPSCSLMLKREYVALAGTQMQRLAERTFDLSEYLMRLKRAGKLSTDFVRGPGRIAYHVPCHLRDQNIGFKSKELLELIGAKVEIVERCSGHDGAWSAKVEFFHPSMKIAAKAVRALTDEPAEIVASDCPLAALQLDQAGIEITPGRRRTVHPIEIVRDAYGLPG